ncbi:putative DNA base hypermodification protein [Amycolatopsis sp., V23-08]|uniref:DNA base hypermodification protein n=1 Tax=Amycolatopsis heterodermiae TaxID=3110235 RepID=A0ABU5QXC2_9PSEU|nr:nucleotide kinase domain-containing protein [Amycolatopsis sp., V23-08]MEA5358295.1 putative DNA base hypermodification protein [Amycolatopsis sp., V23-08]
MVNPVLLRSNVTQLPLALPNQDADPPPVLTIASRALTPTPVFDTYWRFAAERQAVYSARVAGAPGPWTRDPVLLRHRFTNCFRAADRVSQFLIRHVSYRGPQTAEEVVFRTLLFKMFNKVSTWLLLEEEVGDLSWRSFDVDAYDAVLTRAFTAGRTLYSAAYVVPPPRLGGARKHTNHLRLLRLMMDDGVAGRVAASDSLASVFRILKAYPAMGDFLAYQFAIDLNYSEVTEHDEMEFVVAGPGAKDGIRKCFGPASDGIESHVIRYMADHQHEHFARLGLDFAGLWGRPLQLVDCQNLFCEVDKYARVVHPAIAGHSGRSRIKQRFAPVPEPVPAWFPPKWGLRVQV